MAIQTKTMKVKSDTAIAETTTTIQDTVTFETSKLPNGITYKGLKAVLSFADPIQWNKASTYDSLTVVWDDATHASYASKRPVPQNIELTNEFYWFRTADLDAQVEMYRQEVEMYRQEAQKFDGRITANAQAIAAETSRAEGAEQALQDKIDDITCYVNVKSYGVSESNDDNADAFQQAVNDTSERGLILYIPKGTYKMGHKISLPWNCAIIGQSKPFSVLKFASDTGLVADVVDKNNYKTCVGCVLRDFTVEGSYDGYNKLLYDEPWYANRNNDEYMALNHAGIGGWFTVCDISNIRVTKFVLGLATYQPNFSVDVYNNLYNQIYGDLRMFRNIDVSYCNGGIQLRSWDTMLNGFDINRCYNWAPLVTTGGHIANGHSWGTNKGWYIGNGTICTNIEIEAQIHFTSENRTDTQFDGCIIIDSVGQTAQTVLTNVRIWNLPDEAPKNGFYHAPIRLTERSSEPCTILGLSLGRNGFGLKNPDTEASTEYPCRIIETHGNDPKLPVILIGSMSSYIKTIANTPTTGKAFSGDNTLYALMVSSNFATLPKGFQNKTGFNIISTESI